MAKFRFGCTEKGKILELCFSFILIEGSMVRFRLNYIVERKISKVVCRLYFSFIMFSI
jgi:hypothetical protein